MRLVFAALLFLSACSTLPVSTSYLPAESYRDFIYKGKYDQATKKGLVTDEAATVAFCAARINMIGFTPEEVTKLDQFAMMPNPQNRKEAEAIIKSRNTRMKIKNMDAYVDQQCVFKAK